MDLPSATPMRASRVLLLAGDVMTGRGIDQVLMHPAEPTLHEGFVKDARDYVRLAEAVNGPITAPVAADYPWGDALAEMQRVAPDLRIVNLETAITQGGTHWPGKGIHYRMHPANVDCLRAAQLDACALANNHVLDWGCAGLVETLETLRLAGLRFAGAGPNSDAAWAPARLPLPQRSLPIAAPPHDAPPSPPQPADAVLLFSVAVPSSGVPTPWAAGPARAGVALLPDLSRSVALRLAAGIARQRRAGELVVLSIHWGGNWGLDVPPAHREFAHRLIDAGAVDIVHGHSSHHALPVERYGGKLILYGCGDLINDYEGIPQPHGLRGDVGCLYFVKLRASDGHFDGLDIVPLQLRRLRLARADAKAHSWLDRVFRAGAAAGLGAQPVRQGEAWTLPPAGAR
jgi:poly-gamma-glutamate synthesis protein (capsule biosynthesis protein)